MGVVESANYNSRERGLEYFEKHHVKSCKKTKIGYSGVVSGQKEYIVEINLAHPKKSTCTCPFKEGRNVVCKHMVALFYAAHPGVANEIIAERLEAQKRAQQERQMLEKRIDEYVNSLSIDELKTQLAELLLEHELYMDDDFFDEDECDE